MTSSERRRPAAAGDELALVRGFLDHQRDTLLWKVEGLTEDQLAATHPPSTLTLAGLLKHLAFVEDHWFGFMFLGRDRGEPWRSVDWRHDPDWEMRTATDDPGDVLRQLLRDAVAESDRVLDAQPDLDAVSARPRHRDDQRVSLRWILLHMVEEYARHLGHADLLRESIDGQTGT